ncbi:MAG: hypothetical protein KAG19_03595 [Methylococcales bacterium]|nr:hypothetical protein [Methylococcales bacterium]
MERCPCCNARLRERLICSRCKADLSLVIQSEKVAKEWLSQAMDDWSQGELAEGIAALDYSLALKNTQIAQAFKGYIIHQKSEEITHLLAQKQLLPAKQILYQVRNLFPASKTLKEINRFTDYLLAIE